MNPVRMPGLRDGAQDRSQITGRRQEWRTHAADQAVTYTRRFTFSASHELRRLSSTHKCRRNHGHNYTVTVSALARHRQPVSLTAFGDYLDSTFDHRLLNDQVEFHPTSELLADHLARWFTDNLASATSVALVDVVVSETASSSARCDGATGEITITKRFDTAHGEVTLVVGADALDNYGFVTDFGDLAPFAEHLREPAVSTELRDAGPALVSHLANWFIGEVEPKIHGYLVALCHKEKAVTGLWQREVRA